MKRIANGNLAIILKRRSLATLTGVFAGGNLVSLILRMVGGILTARVVGPAVLGLFNGLGLVLSYAPFLQLGILNGLSRELPYYIGRGEDSKARDLAAAAQAWSLIIGGVVSLGLLGLSAWFIFQRQWQLAAGWATYAFGAMALLYGQYYLQITYRTRGDFARLALYSVITNGIGVLSVALVWKFGFYGLCLRSLGMGLVNLGLLWHWRPIRVQPRWDKHHIWQLLKIGVPIFAVGQIYGLWVAVDATLVLHFMSSSGLGLYQLAIIVSSTVSVLPAAVSGIAYPRMAEEYGRTNKLEGLIGIVRKPILYMTLGAIPAVFLAWQLIPPITQLILPKYADGMAAAQWMLVVTAISCLTPVNDVFNVVKRQDLYVVAMAVGIATYGGSLLWLIKGGVYLAAFPQAMVVGQAVFVAFCYMFLTYLWRKDNDIA